MQYIDIYHNSHKIYLHFKAWSQNIYKNATSIIGTSDNLLTIAVDVRDVGSISGLERSPGEGNGNPLQYSFLKNPMNRGAWQAMVHSVTKSQTWLKQLACRHVVNIKPRRRDEEEKNYRQNKWWTELK